MEKCFEYFRCNKPECPAYDKSGKLKCWETDNTLCHHNQTQDLITRYNRNKCHYCTYYKQYSQQS